MGCFTLKIQITFFSRVPHTSLCVPLGVRVPQFGKHCSTAITQTDRQTDPQQVSGDVALLVPTAGPPPLCLLLVLPAQDGHAVPLPVKHTHRHTHTHTLTHTHTHTHTHKHTHTHRDRVGKDSLHRYLISNASLWSLIMF